MQITKERAIAAVGSGKWADHRVARSLKQPTSIETEMCIMAMDGDEMSDPLDELLDQKDASVYRAIVARINFLSFDRPDVQYASKEAIRHMSASRLRDWGLGRCIG